MKITLSSYNQMPENHGRKPHGVWLQYEDGSTRCLGYAIYTTYKIWTAELDNLKGGKIFFSGRTLSDIRYRIRQHYM